MRTATPKPIVHIFKEYNIGKFKTTRHYKLEKVLNGSNQLTDIINISKDRNCAQSMPDYWLQVREGKRWKKPRLTGLFRTGKNFIYKGDTDNRTNLVLFKFSESAEALTIYFYSNFYTKDITSLLNTI
ncbi:hypothetical protein [Psychroserpens mesophilus]|uniref:hypothetical protein n=1 Tax=Psychroserpens mesophilus TaxID=325473 RepID=UPI00058C352C|nr:hypothetical protein [Psychroserpens mesophilus]